MRYLGLDIGTKTIGVAASDPLGWTAQPITTIRYKSTNQACHLFWELVQDQEAQALVVGLPLNMNGTEGPQAGKVKQMVQRLVDFCGQKGNELKVHYWDERLSTVAAERTLLEADVSRAKRKQVIDKMAAVYILQGFLDSK